MEFRGDERAVVIQIGAVLLLAALVIAMAGYQATVVPDQNGEIEFNHNQEVHGQLQDLRNGIVSTAGGSQGGAYSLTLGTNYPARALFVNPAPPSGQLRTLGTGQVVIENADAMGGGGAGKYWSGATRTVNTTTFAYQPNYNEWDNAPTTIYEHSLLYDAHPTGADTTVAEQVLIDGDEITLVTLAGELQASSSATTSVDVRTVSASTNAVTVESTASNPIRITVPTRRPRIWSSALDGDATIVNNQTTGDYVNTTIELDPGEYELRMARARVGEASSGPTPDTDAEYLVAVDDGGPVPKGEPTTVVAEVRNRHNNPVADAEVRYNVSGGTTSTTTTDGNGRVRIDAEGGDTVGVWINATDFSGATPYERFSIDVRVGGGGGGSNAYDVYWDTSKIAGQNGISCPDRSPRGSCTFDVGQRGSPDATLSMYTDAVADGATVDYAISNTSVIELGSNRSTTDGNGESGTTVTAKENGTVTVYASSGSDGDALEVTVTNVSDDTTPTPSGPRIDSFDVQQLPGNGKVGIRYSFAVSSGDGSFESVRVVLERADDGFEVDREGYTPTGNTFSVNNEKFEGLGTGQEYDVTLVVESTAGQDSETIRQAAG